MRIGVARAGDCTARCVAMRLGQSVSRLSPLWYVVLLGSILHCHGSAAAASRTYVDSVGRTVEVVTPLLRIISLAPSVTEILFALQADDQLVAVTDFCDYPEAAQQKPKVGAMYHPNIERILAFQPDLVITAIGASRKETVLRLERLGVAVYVLHATEMGEIMGSIIRVGELVAQEEAAQRLVENLRKRLMAVQERLSGRRAVRTLYLLWYQPLMTVGRETFLQEVIALAGGHNLASDALVAYPTYSLEQVITAAPEVIVLNKDSAPFKHLVAEQPQRWSHVPAVRDQRIYVVDTGLINRPGPRSVDAVEHLARLFHPEVFPPDLQERR